MPLKVPTFQLLSGHSIPLIGLGSYLIDGDQTKTVLDRALTAGYRMIDTAAMYGNEHDLGSALKELLPKHNLKREDIFITTKLYPADHGGDKAKNAIAESLKKLQCRYIDLYLIHWPGVYGVSSHSSQNAILRSASWAALVQAKNEGLIRDIGVSNYTLRHLKELLANCHGEKPVLNQMEWHPGCYEEELREFCKEQGILVQAYMPLGGGGNKSLLCDPLVTKIAKKLSKDPAQVLLQWCLQQGVAVIPKAQSKEHLEANINLDFVIEPNDIVLLNAKERERYDWDPNTIK